MALQLARDSAEKGMASQRIAERRILGSDRAEKIILATPTCLNFPSARAAAVAVTLGVAWSPDAGAASDDPPPSRMFAADTSGDSANARTPSFDERKTETSGPAGSAGIGTQYALVGVQLSYYLQLAPRLRVAPYVGVGRVVGGPDENLRWTTGAAAGVIGSWGERHRALVNLAFGTVATSYDLRDDDEVAIKNDWGPSLSLGYEYMASSGFFVRSDLGVGIIVTDPYPSETSVPRDRASLVATLVGVGWKLW